MPLTNPSDFGPVYKRMPESKKHVKNFTELQDIFPVIGAIGIENP